jgi:hypothetical protein
MFDEPGTSASGTQAGKTMCGRWPSVVRVLVLVHKIIAAAAIIVSFAIA